MIGVGTRVGLLTVEEATEQRKAGYTVWRCRCACGGEILLDTRCLQRGTVRDCGCQTVVKPGQRDISGMRFGRLVAVSPTRERGASGSTVWLCQCDCGKEVKAELGQLTWGYKKSCGCLGHPPRKDFMGKRFGKLTVIAYAGKRAGMHRWKCRCECGKETVVGQTLLQTGKTKSCGCLQAIVYRKNLELVEGTSLKALRAVKSGRLIKSNTSGYNGVYFDKKRKRWVAQITFQGKTRYLGAFPELADAVKARKQGEEIYDRFLDQYDGTDGQPPVSREEEQGET
ncbi:MAG: AP2 domain-containing protein [Lachnospiraceae bacterium]|nr:AP2 domain-containing protein [Lachnospiraceae bacterium]